MGKNFSRREFLQDSALAAGASIVQAFSYQITASNNPTSFNATSLTAGLTAAFGHHAAAACHMANESYFRQAAVSYDAAKEKLKV